MKPDPAIGRRITEILDDPASSDTEFAGADGLTYRVRKRPAPGIKATVERRGDDEPFELMFSFFEPSAERPADYPSELLFMPDAESMVGGLVATVPPTRMVVWADLDDAGQFAERLLERCRAEGWTRADDGTSAPPFGPMARFRRGPASRMITATPRGVFVMQSEHV
jgi:hypothetical protein